MNEPGRYYYMPSKPKAVDPLKTAIHIGKEEYEYLSNLHRAKVYLPGDEEPYPTVEHAFQASKTEDVQLRSEIRAAPTAIAAKKAARKIAVSDAWRSRSEAIMEALVRDKFRRHDKYREQLLGTGAQLLAYVNEHNDKLWGVCDGKGGNKLGLLLMRVRDDIKQSKDVLAWARTCFDLEEGKDVQLQLQISKGGAVLDTPVIEGTALVQFGKVEGNDVLMEHPSTSRRHALLLVPRAGRGGAGGVLPFMNKKSEPRRRRRNSQMKTRAKEKKKKKKKSTLR
eukprot:TRINITY_DN27519_c0_g1_i1.p1 TRINITY_DN27519_c0_g1~~TRINITY_DN27519_c0_g1_i1.p1  ORF type:complete len:281 (-),score=58.98 TRINITY_DN27519_c0_g1_i1:4-846(-)